MRQKFKWNNKELTIKQLSEELNIKYHTLERIIQQNKCKTIDDIIKNIGPDNKHPRRVIPLEMKFNHWTIIDVNPIFKDTHLYYKVQCDCGTIEYKTLSDLKRTKGCQKCRGIRSSIKLNIGDKFGHWTVISKPISRNRYLYYQVQCDCGTIEWKRPGTIQNPESNACIHCSRKRKTKEIKLRNGMVGELSVTKFSKIKRAAKERNLEFNVTMFYLWNLFLKQNKTCALTGDVLENIDKASLDRIDSSKGYIEGNVQWTTSIANICKYTLTMEEFVCLCNKIVNHANQQPSQPLTKLEGSETND